jgi:hypothetical protein
MRERIETYVIELGPKLATRTSRDGVKFAILGDSDGDSCLFNGLLSSSWLDSSVNWPLGAVLGCQGLTGMFYRSPDRAENDQSGFSRDQATGVILAAADPRFPESEWAHWLRYIDKSRPCSIKKPWGGGCLVRSPIYYYAPDDRSAISPSCWAMMGRVSKYRGWTLHSQMKSYEGADGDIQVIEAEKCEVGYQLHLKAVDAFIKLVINQSREYSQKVGEIAFSRVPDNLFYEFLAKREFTEDMVRRFLEIAPSPNTVFGNAWVWEKSSVASHIGKTCGWDFVFLANLILKFY